MAQTNPFDQFDQQPANAPIVIGGPDPTIASKERRADAQIELARERLSLAKAADARAAQALALQQQNAAQSGGLTKEARNKLESDYAALTNLEQGIEELRMIYEQGPGKTKGLGGFQDYLPYTANQRFDEAGNRLSAYVASALGLSGQQFNTPAEQQLFVGSYLPKASDRDETIKDKIGALERILSNARSSAEQRLGIKPQGQPEQEPDASAILTPTGGGGGMDAGGGMRGGNEIGSILGGANIETGVGAASRQRGSEQIAKGDYRTERDDEASALIDRMVRAGYTVDQINEALPSGFNPVSQDAVDAARKYLKDNPGFRGSVGLAERTLANNTLTQMAGSPFGAYAINAADAAIPLAMLTGDREGTHEALAAVRSENPLASTGGMLAGGTLAALGGELSLARLGATGPWAARGGDLLYGAVQGGGNAAEGEDFAGAAIGGLSGLGGGMLGRGVVSGIGNAAGGVRNESVQALRDADVPLTAGRTVGQSGVVGRTVRGIEDRLAGIPFIGDVVNARRIEELEGFNREMFRQGGEPIGANVTALGEEGVEQLRAARSQAYDNAVQGRFAAEDPQYLADYQTALSSIRSLPNIGAQVGDEIDAIVPGYFAAGNISGPNAQAAIKELKGLRASYKNDALGSRIGNNVRDVESALTGLVERQNPGFAGDLANANLAHSNLKVIEEAVRRAGRNDGLAMPSQLDMASQQSAARFGGNAATTGRQFFDLSRAGQQVLPSKIPDSGTAGRLATVALPATLGGAGAGAGTALGDTGEGAQAGLSAGVLLALGGSRQGQRLLTTLLADRPDLLRRIGEQVNRLAPIGGVVGAPLAVQGTVGP